VWKGTRWQRRGLNWRRVGGPLCCAGEVGCDALRKAPWGAHFLGHVPTFGQDLALLLHQPPPLAPLPTSLSNFLRGRSSLYARCTSLPRRASMPANSTPAGSGRGLRHCKRQRPLEEGLLAPFVLLTPSPSQQPLTNVAPANDGHMLRA